MAERLKALVLKTRNGAKNTVRAFESYCTRQRTRTLMKTRKRRRRTIAEMRLASLEAQRCIIGKTVVNVEYRNYQYFRWTFDDGSYQEWFSPCKGMTAYKTKNQKGR